MQRTVKRPHVLLKAGKAEKKIMPHHALGLDEKNRSTFFEKMVWRNDVMRNLEWRGGGPQERVVRSLWFRVWRKAEHRVHA
jgi:hypothetical protein